LIDADRTRVDLSIGYTLKGTLAQLGRPALVQGLATRITAEFANNLDRRLSGAPEGVANAAPSDLNGLSLFFGAVRAYVARCFVRIGRRSG
jgi:carbon-monoxide dehydrogenase small subunit